MMNRKSYAQSAKELRAALKAKWPGVKFSVTKSGHNCADVAWVDGPTWEQVNKFCDPFEGADFDGMQDLEMPRDNDSGIKYIFPSRDFSEAFLLDTLEAMKERYNFKVMPTLRYDGPYNRPWLDFSELWAPGGGSDEHWARAFLAEREG